MKLILQAIILTVSFTILACGNQNPTKTQSDPLRGREFKGATKLLDPKQNDGVPVACAKTYSMAITTQDGQPVVDQGNLSFIVGQKTTYRITVPSTKYPDLKLSLRNNPDNVTLTETQSASPRIWNLTFTPTADQGNMKFNAEIILPVPADDVCVSGTSAELLVLNVGFGKALPSVNVVDFNTEVPYPNTSIQAFHVDVVDPNIHDGEAPRPPAFDFSNYYGTDQNGNNETLFLSGQNAVNCNPNANKIAAQAFRFTCSIDFNKIPMTLSGYQFGHSDFVIYGVSVTGDKSTGESIGMTISYPPSAQPQPAKAKTTTKTKAAASSSGDHT